MEPMGPLEARLLALERGQARIEDELRGLKRDVITIGQALWQSWGEGGSVAEEPQKPAPSTCTGSFPNVCDCIPLVLTLRDSYYGNTDLTYDPDHFWWTGCRLVSYPGTIVCPSATTPIRYTLFGDNSTPVWVLKIAWKGVNIRGALCPLGTATCADTLPLFRTSSATFHCPPALTSWVTTGGNEGQIYPTGVSAALSIGSGKIPGCPNVLADRLYLRDSVYGSTTLDFNGLAWTGCKVVNFPGYSATPCAAASGVAVHYELLTSGFFRIRYDSATPGTTMCPRASTCAATTGVNATSAAAVTVDSCAPFRAHFTATAATGFKILGDGADSGIVINLADTLI